MGLDYNILFKSARTTPGKRKAKNCQRTGSQRKRRNQKNPKETQFAMKISEYPGDRQKKLNKERLKTENNTKSNTS